MMTEKKNRKSSKGFSLVELIVVVAIIAIVSSMSVGGFYMIKKSTINSASKGVETAIEKAQGYAVSEQHDETCAVFYYEDNKLKCCTGFVDSSTGNISFKDMKALGSKVTVDVTDSSGTSVTVSETTSVKVFFDPRSGKVTKITSGSKNSINSDAEVSQATSSYADFVIRFTNNSGKQTKLTLYYSNGAID